MIIRCTWAQLDAITTALVPALVVFMDEPQINKLALLFSGGEFLRVRLPIGVTEAVFLARYSGAVRVISMT